MTLVPSRASIDKMVAQITSVAQNFLPGSRSVVPRALASPGQLELERSTRAHAHTRRHTRTLSLPVLNLNFSK